VLTKLDVIKSFGDPKKLGHPVVNTDFRPARNAVIAYVWVENADALYSEFQSKGIKIARDICDQPYGCRDFDIEDCNGYRLCFGHEIKG
jgi:predicted enzyme related to lactoylglutathione lyase